ncbi:MAG: FkbM family methyltransferase, partial [Candidatus Taylorbacteria bacterium]|nr:FkbM family methyltransferase [Candidatus Taylorbacteria bacterium]
SSNIIKAVGVVVGCLMVGVGTYLYLSTTNNKDELSKSKIETIKNQNKPTNILAEKYPSAQIYAFECLPENILLCKKNINSTNIHLVEYALSNKEATLNFFVTEEGGSSSLYEHVGGNKAVIQVQARRLDSFSEIHPTLLWLDAQGGEMDILEGCGDRFNDIQVIQTEVSFLKGYKNQPSYWDIKKYLKQRGYNLAGFTSDIWTYADAVFVKRNTPPAICIELYHAVLKKVYKLIKNPKKIFQYLAFLKKIPTTVKVISKGGEYENKV